MSCQLVNPLQFFFGAVFLDSDREPGCHPTPGVTDGEGVIAEDRVECGNRSAIVKSGQVVAELRLAGFHQRPVQQLSILGAGVESPSLAVEGQSGNRAVIRQIKGFGK